MSIRAGKSTEAAKVLQSVVKPHFPGCRINPVGNSKFAKPIKGTVFELHGSRPKLSAPCIVNLDGEDISWKERKAILPQFIKSTDLPGYRKRYAQCEANFLWIAEHNGIKKGNFIDPRKRKNYPSRNTYKLIRRELRR